MARTAFATHPVHGSDADAITAINADMPQFNSADGHSLVVTGHEIVLLVNPAAGAAVHVTVPPNARAQGRNQNLIKRFRIPGGTAVPLPKFTAQNWSQGAEGIHVDADETIHSEGTLTLSSVPTAADTITVGERVYTFRAAATVAGDIQNGADVPATLVNVAAAINGDSLNDPNPDVVALTPGASTLVLEALVGGAGGDTKPTTSSLTDVGSGFDGTTLGTTVAGGAGSARLRYLVLTDPTD